MTAVKYPKIRSLSEFAVRCIPLLVAVAISSPALADPLPLFSATYKVHYGILHGEMTLELRRADGAGYVYETSLTPRGVVTIFRRGSIVETTSLEIEDGVLRPRDYHSTDTIADPTRTTVYRFDAPEGRVTGVYKERQIDEPMRPRGHHRISAHVAVMLAMNTGEEMTTIPVFDRARWRDFGFEKLPAGIVKTRLGEFEAVEIRYSSDTKDKSWSLFCAEALDYAPVMIVFSEDGDVKSRAELVAYESLAEDPPDDR